MPAVIRESKALQLDAKHTIESIGCTLLSMSSQTGVVEAPRLFFELRIVLQRILILSNAGMTERLRESGAWSAILEMDLEQELFHVEHRSGNAGDHLGRIWGREWVTLLQRDFISCGGKWFSAFVEHVLSMQYQMGSVDESLMGWSARIVDDRFELYSESESDRKAGGVFYTPSSLVGYVLDRTLAPAMDACGEDVEALLSLRVCDPACGCGYFLIESAKRIADRVESIGGGERLEEVVRNCVAGYDIHPVTVEICRWMLLGMMIKNHRVANLELAMCDLRASIVCTDPLVDEAVVGTGGNFDIVVGNPPFLNQLRDGTVRDRARAEALRGRGLVGGATYTDDASAFLVLGLQIAREGGRVSMVQPQSVLATKGGAWAREQMLERGSLESLWVSNEHVFGDASVYTCVPCVVVGGAQKAVERYSTGRFIEHRSLEIHDEDLRSLETWSSVAAITMGVPEIACKGAGVIGDLALATADFRDEYYGLEGNLVEDGHIDGGVALVTTGLVDLGRCWWGQKPTRILKQRWESPRVNRLKMQRDDRLDRWVRGRAVEKVLVPTQTKVVEVLVDNLGEYAAVTPMISVMPKNGQDVWAIGAAIGSPVCTLHAMRHFGGAAMHADAIKMSAKQVLCLPLPVDSESWGRGTELFQELHHADEGSYKLVVREFGMMMCNAYCLNLREKNEVMKWWITRLGF
ncbi:MAG: class I SAM-dependent DNA methyltransferase [Phycisphaerales bacterium]